MPASESSRFRQLPLRQMMRGLARPIATIRLEPNDISKKIGIHFEAARDDLDELQAAVIRTNSGRQFAFVRHRHQPGLGTDILTDEHSSNLERDFQEILRVLPLRRKDVSWMHPKIGHASDGIRHQVNALQTRVAALFAGSNSTWRRGSSRTTRPRAGVIAGRPKTINIFAVDARKTAVAHSAKLAAATKARWAKGKGRQASKKKRRLSAAGRKRLSRLLKARWAARKRAAASRK